MSELVELVYNQLQKQIDRNAKNIVTATNTSEQSQYADGIPAYTFANLPASGLANGTSYITLAWVTNGRKAGEGAGNGTGVLAIYNPATATWLRVGENYDSVTT